MRIDEALYRNLVQFLHMKYGNLIVRDTQTSMNGYTSEFYYAPPQRVPSMNGLCLYTAYTAEGVR